MTRFRADIEGLRAIAVLAVVLFHAGVPGFGGGYVGVDVFFVISGFLITGLLLRDEAPSPWKRLRHFYARRLRRILPAATLVIACTLIGAALLANPLTQRTARTDAIAAMFFFSNIRFEQLATDYFAQGSGPSLFQHYWSLSVEEQFYLLWPALLIGVGVVAATRSRSAVVVAVGVVGVLSFALHIAFTFIDAPFAFFMLPTRAWELCVGAGLALAATRVRLSEQASSIMRGAGLGVIVLAVVILNDQITFPVLAVVGAALVITAGMPSPDHEGARLGVWPLRQIGRYSYSLYLWHWPALLLVSLRRPSVLTNWGEALLVMALIALPGAIASFHLVESPFRREFTGRPDTHALAAGAGLVALFGALLVPYSAALSDSPDTGKSIATVDSTPANAADFVPANLEPALADAAKVPPGALRCHKLALGCVTGTPGATRSMVLFGDSQANHWVLAFGMFGEREGWRVEVIGSPGCRSFVEPQSEFGENCDQFRRRANARIEELRPEVVVFSNQSSEYFARDQAAWARGVGAAIDALPDGVRAAVFSQTPRAAQRVPECLADHLDDTRACEPKRASMDALNAALRTVAERHGAAFLDLSPWFCTATRCPVVMGNVLVYRDRSHLTARFTTDRADDLARAVAAALA